MKLLVATLMCFVLCASAYPLDDSFSEFRGKFAMWKNYFNKIYETEEEEAHRMENFEMNLNIIRYHNYIHDLNEKSYRLEMNRFGDMNATEYKNAMNGRRTDLRKVKSNPRGFLSEVNSTLPDSVDWRDHGYVTHVKDQGGCNSCWSFSATGVLEGQMKRKTGKLVSLSEQNLIDCDTKNGGCNNGGLKEVALDYIRINGGIDTEESYPYEDIYGTCRFSKANIGGKDIGYTNVDANEYALKQAVAKQGPIAVAIDSSQESFKLYSSGVYDEPECGNKNKNLDHEVLVVGYGTDEETGLDFWLVKNSWGTHWGEEGYIRMIRGENNQCGIATDASYPLV